MSDYWTNISKYIGHNGIRYIFWDYFVWDCFVWFLGTILSGTVLSGNILQFGTVLSGIVLSGTVLSGHDSKYSKIKDLPWNSFQNENLPTNRISTLGILHSKIQHILSPIVFFLNFQQIVLLMRKKMIWFRWPLRLRWAVITHGRLVVIVIDFFARFESQYTVTTQLWY